MNLNGLSLPENFQEGREYLLKTRDKTGVNGWVPVRFVAYRPHPGELVVAYDGKKVLVHRRFLFEKKGMPR